MRETLDDAARVGRKDEREFEIAFRACHASFGLGDTGTRDRGRGHDLVAALLRYRTALCQLLDPLGLLDRVLALRPGELQGGSSTSS